jgi:hypothetical protein
VGERAALTSEIPHLHLDAVDMQVWHIDVPRPRPPLAAGFAIDAGATVIEFVAVPVRQREAVVAVTDAGEVPRKDQ